MSAVSETPSDAGAYRAAFVAGCVVPTSVGVGCLLFFLVPDTLSSPAVLAVTVPFLAVAYFAFLRYDFAVDRMVADGTLADSRPRLAAFRLQTMRRIGTVGGISPVSAWITLGLGFGLLVAGIGVALAAVAIG